MIKLKNKISKKKIINLVITSTLITFFLIDLFSKDQFFLDNILPTVFEKIFADLRTIIQSIDELKKIDTLGVDKISSSELWGRPMNYPNIWVYFFSFLKVFGNPVFIFGIFQISIYILFSKFILLKTKDFFYVNFFILFSPTLLLMMERGNNDTIIFFLLLFSILLKNYLSGFLLGLAICLKIFPIFVLPFYFFFRKFNKKFFIGLSVMLPFIFWTLFQIMTSLENTAVEASYSASFGIYSLSMFFIAFVKEIFFIEIDNNYLIYLNILFFFIFMSFSLIFNYFFKKDILNILKAIKKNKKYLMIFILFSTQSILIFFTFSSYAYRIIFLLPAVLIFINNLKNFDNISYIKKIFYFILSTSPFLSPWLLISFFEDVKNFHIWVLYSSIIFSSMIFYFAIIINFYYDPISKLYFKICLKIKHI